MDLSGLGKQSSNKSDKKRPEIRADVVSEKQKKKTVYVMRMIMGAPLSAALMSFYPVFYKTA